MEGKDTGRTSQIIIDDVSNKIMSNRLKPGDKLPPERELMEELKIGRPAIREGLRALEIMGIIESKHGVGNFITNNVIDNFSQPFALSIHMDNSTPYDVVNMRLCLESFAVKEIASTGAKDVDIEKLKRINEDMISGNSIDAIIESDFRFHTEIIRMAGNSLLSAVHKSVSRVMIKLTGKAVVDAQLGKNSDSVENIYREHKRIIDAISEKNSEEAEKAVWEHLSNIGIK